MNTQIRESWIDGYLEYTSELECPRIFSLWMGIGVVAACMQRKCSMNWPTGDIFPNMFIVLCGPSGEARKGTAMSPAKRLLTGAGIALAPNATTKEGVVDCMVDARGGYTDPENGLLIEHCSITVFSSELTVFTGYNDSDMLSYLCDWFDGSDDWKKRTRGRGLELINGVCMNLMGATTPISIAKAIPIDMTEGGFTSRVVFVCGLKREKKVCPIVCDSENREVVQVNLAKERSLINGLSRILSICGRFYFTPGARAAFYEWYNGSAEEDTRLEHARFGGYNSRRPTHLAKLCMIHSASCGDDRLITEDDFNVALGWLYEVEKEMPFAFEGYGTLLTARIESEVLKFVRNRSKVSMQDILIKFSGDIDIASLAPIIDNLKAKGYVSYVVDAGGGYVKANK